MKNENRHQWVLFYNPRNGRVKILACEKCGLPHSDANEKISCRRSENQGHRFLRMGWKVLPKYA